jgi:acetylornithine deacetylase/succinyl-diaminopimelate desuccinylase-like protein
MKAKLVVTATVTWVTLGMSSGTYATDPASERALFHAIYKELVETNTSHSAGDTTLAAHRMEKRLRDAGFTDTEVQVVEPFPKKGNLVLRFPGDGTRRPLLLLAHLDVVEAKREEWTTDPFTLVETEGYFTARGAADDKAMAAAFVSVLSQLKREDFTPHRDLILALTADEERGGVPTNGARWLVQNHREWIDAEFGLNEGGGGELINGKPTIQRIQVAEKIYTTYELVAHNAGGHSSLPRPDNAIYDITGAVTRIGQYTFPVKLGPVTRDYFARSAALFTGQRALDMQSISAGQTDPDAITRLSAEPLYNATLRTTCVTTMLSAGHAENALAQTARATVNCRVLPWDDLAEVDQKLRELVGNPTIEITQTMAPTKSPPSPLTATILEPVEQISAAMWPGVPVIPTLSTGATDSLWLRNVGIPMYGVSGIFADVNDVHAHGLNERVEQARLYDGREFLYRLIKRLAD